MSKIKSISPLFDLLVIKPDEQEEKTESGLVMPKTLDFVSKMGTVIAIGPGRTLDDGSRITPSVKVGDRVIWSPKTSGEEVETEDGEVFITNEANLLGKIE